MHFLSVKCRNLGRASPCNQRSTVKYSCTKGGFNRSIFKDLGINSALITNKLVGAGNASLAQSTWKRYGALHSHIKFAETLSGVKLTFPFSTKSVLILVGAMLVKELQPSTIDVYLSALKAWHLTKCIVPPILRTDLVNTILRGEKNRLYLSRELMVRSAITLQDMLLIRKRLKELKISTELKLLFWATCTWLFWGCFRIHEVLAPQANDYDATSTLLWRDVQESVIVMDGKNRRMLTFTLKCPKESKGKSVRVEMFETGNKLCPVKAYQSWKKFKDPKLSASCPVSRMTSGGNLTGKRFNILLKQLTDPFAKGRYLRSHSFRAALPTIMGQNGYSDQQIQIQGRWRSDAFLRYCKMGRSLRWKDQMELMDRVPCLFAV